MFDDSLLPVAPSEVLNAHEVSGALHQDQEEGPILQWILLIDQGHKKGDYS